MVSAKEQLELLKKGVVDLQQEEELAARLEESVKSRKPLTVKAGYDPTAPDLHLGHTVVLTKMKQFQDLGHRVVFLIGDFTGMIGDPTGKSETRKALTPKQVAANAETYKNQVFKILDPEKTVVDFNSRWMSTMGAADLISLASKYNVARMLERDDFRKRYAEHRPVAIHEFLYPLIQAYDSVALNADVEMGGTDQLFNLLVGRDIQRQYGQRPQVVMTMPILEGTDAKVVDGVLTGDKMSKSLNNYIGINDPPDQMFGKIMSVCDELMWRFYQLLSTRPWTEVEQMKEQVAHGQLNPKQAKIAIGLELVGRYHGAQAAESARHEFEERFAKGNLPSQIEEVQVAMPQDTPLIANVLLEAGLVSTTSEGRRMLTQGAVKVDEAPIGDPNATLLPGANYLIQVGKRRIKRVNLLKG